MATGFDPNNLYYYMTKTYSENKRVDNKIIFCNEGSSRSSKTIDAFHLIETFCSHAKTPLLIGVFRNTLKDCREKTFDDFKKFLGPEIRNIYNPENARRELTSPDYILHGSRIEFRGLDEDTEQKGYDIVFVNEALEVQSERSINGLFIRCRKLMIFDWNPKYTQHWIFNWSTHPNVYFTKTTYKNNKHLEESIVSGIESKSPWHLDDLHLAESKRRPHEENIKNGTVDKWYFEVYGMGQRSNRSGLVFPNVTWVQSLPTMVDKHFYGLDFGNTTGIYAFSQGCKQGNKLYFDVPIYGSFADHNEIIADSNSGLKRFYQALNQWYRNNCTNIDGTFREIVIVSDSAQPMKIRDLNAFAIRDGLKMLFVPVEKTPGCIKWRCDVINRYDLHFVLNDWMKKEQENYAYKEIRGIQLDEPIDDFNHGFDACGYSIQYQADIIYANN